MGKYSIPINIRDGFHKIASLSPLEASIISNSLSSAKVGGTYRKIFEENKESLSFIPEEDFKRLLTAILSLTKIFIESKDTIDVFSKVFADSYLDVTNDKELAKSLNENLNIILPAINTIKVTQKARELQVENKNNFSEARIISDIRMVFDDDDMDKKHQYAVIVHHLKFIYFSSENKNKEFYISLDISDLKELQDIVNRAIKKEASIKSKNHDLEFIDLK